MFDINRWHKFTTQIFVASLKSAITVCVIFFSVIVFLNFYIFKIVNEFVYEKFKNTVYYKIVYL